MTSRVMGLGVLVATAVHAQAVAPAPSTPVPVPRTEEVMRAIERREKEAITTALWQARLCEAFQSLPSIEGLHAVIVAWLERQFPRPVSR